MTRFASSRVIGPHATSDRGIQTYDRDQLAPSRPHIQRNYAVANQLIVMTSSNEAQRPATLVLLGIVCLLLLPAPSAGYGLDWAPMRDRDGIGIIALSLLDHFRPRPVHYAVHPTGSRRHCTIRSRSPGPTRAWVPRAPIGEWSAAGASPSWLISPDLLPSVATPLPHASQARSWRGAGGGPTSDVPIRCAGSPHSTLTTPRR